MKKRERRFIERVECLIDPEEVCDLAFVQRFKRLLPKAFFKRMLYKASKKFPRIGFVIEPYCLFLFFPIEDREKAQAMLPERYELVETRITKDEEPGYYHGMGIFNTKGSTFWGTRLESYLIARDRESGLVSWIFVDIVSNTLIAMPRYGIADRNSGRTIFTTTSKGELLIDIAEKGSDRRLKLTGRIARGVRTALDRPLWLGGNTSIAFVERLSGGDDEPFAVIFDPAEVDTALDIPLEDISIEENTIKPGFAAEKPAKALCFPFAQHYVADSPGCRTRVADEPDMLAHYARLADGPEIATFSARGVRKLMLAGGVAALLGTVALAAALAIALAA